MKYKMKNVIGKFYGITYGKELIEFIVYDNNTLDCPRANIKDAYFMRLKPRFVLCSPEDYHFEYRVTVCGRVAGRHEDLIAKYVIDKDLLNHMINRNMIEYSEDMAYLYHLDDRGSFDKGLVKHRYKRALKKGHILKKQREGKFNY